MSAQDVILGSRVAHVRELKAEVGRLKAENAALRSENAALAAHLDLAILAAGDLAALGDGGRLVVVDGWNLILGAEKSARDRDDLVRRAREHVAAHPADFVWIVLDGPRASSTAGGRVRVSYTGGTGAHRADRLVCDFLRMAKLRGDLDRIEVRTNDRDFRRDVERIRS